MARGAVLGLVLLVTGCGAGGIQVHDPWARSTPAMATMGAAYLTITSGSADRLIGIEVPQAVASRAEIHETVRDSLVTMRMRPVSGVDLPAGQSIEFRPGSYHVMLVGLARPLVAGQSFAMTLRFEHAGAVTMRVRVRGL
jgi:copper(I)-binding protein